MTDRLITLEHFGSAAEAHVARAELDAAGIRAAVGDDAAAEMLSIMGAGLGGVKLLVFQRDAQRARTILEQHQKAKGPGVPAWICHECFSVVDAGFEVCWSCGATYDPPNPYLSSSTKAEALHPPAPPLPATNDAEHLVLLAFRGAVLGLVFCPGILHVYSLWLLLRVSLRGEELSPKANGRFYIALAIDLLFGLFLFPYALLSMYRILNTPYSH